MTIEFMSIYQDELEKENESLRVKLAKTEEELDAVKDELHKIKNPPVNQNVAIGANAILQSNVSGTLNWGSSNVFKINPDNSTMKICFPSVNNTITLEYEHVAFLDGLYQRHIQQSKKQSLWNKIKSTISTWLTLKRG